MSPFAALQTLETPAVVVDYPRLVRNIARAQRIADDNRLRLRPHIKTHKCIELARLQLGHGACGITAAKASEALVFVEADFPSVTVAYPVIDAAKANRLIEAARATMCDLRFIADSQEGAEALSRAASAQESSVGVYIKIDVGLGRVGLKHDAEALPSLARRIVDSPGLRFCGLLSHAGQSYGATGRQEVGDIAEDERRQLLAASERLSSLGLGVPELSVGSTPTVLAAANFEGLSEIRPGNYVFFDLTAIRLGVATLAEVALSVLTTVVSVNDTYAIIDAGSKVLSSDLGPHGSGGLQGFGQAFRLERDIDEAAPGSELSVERLSEEHGFVRHKGARLRVGDRLRVVPNHSCPVANLSDDLCILNGEESARRWKVAAAGRVT